MPEGDTIHNAARRVGAALVGKPIVGIETPQERHRLDRWADRLAGRGVRAVDAHGKHLFARFDGDPTLHSHLRMGGKWGVYRNGERGIGDALLDQRNLAGIGNIWKSESCFMTGLDPWRRVGEVEDEEALAAAQAARAPMRLSAERGGWVASWEPERPVRGRENRTWVYNRAGLPCRRCGTRIRARGQGDDNRTTYWCPECQR